MNVKMLTDKIWKSFVGNQSGVQIKWFKLCQSWQPFQATIGYCSKWKI